MTTALSLQKKSFLVFKALLDLSIFVLLCNVINFDILFPKIQISVLFPIKNVFRCPLFQCCGGALVLDAVWFLAVDGCQLHVPVVRLEKFRQLRKIDILQLAKIIERIGQRKLFFFLMLFFISCEVAKQRRYNFSTLSRNLAASRSRTRMAIAQINNADQGSEDYFAMPTFGRKFISWVVENLQPRNLTKICMLSREIMGMLSHSCIFPL